MMKPSDRPEDLELLKKLLEAVMAELGPGYVGTVLRKEDSPPGRGSHEVRG